jgi:hypothetical protein
MSDADDTELIDFMAKIGFEYHPSKHYPCFTKNEGTCELTVRGAEEVKQAINDYYYQRVMEMVDSLPQMGLIEDDGIRKEYLSVDDLRTKAQATFGKADRLAELKAELADQTTPKDKEIVE